MTFEIIVFIPADGASSTSLYEVPISVIVVLCFFYGAISVTAAVGNALVIYVVVVSRRMHTVTNYYIANLALGTDGPSINDVHTEGEGGWPKG